MNSVIETLLIRIHGDQAEEVVDWVPTEIAFTLVVNGQTLVSLLCSPNDLEAMAIGFLLSEGILSQHQSLEEVVLDETRGVVRVIIKDLPDNWQDHFNKKTITSGCGKGITFTNSANLRSLSRNRIPIQLSTKKVKELLAVFRSRCELYNKTGGVHSAALSDGKDISLFAEDIGRHNAVDKLIGKAFLQSISLEDKVVFSSGRISGEIMTKLVRNKIPVLITKSAPTCMSISYAEDYGVTLIGFARGNRMNIYTHPLGVVFTNVNYP